MTDRQWNTGYQQWVTETQISDALEAAVLAILEYHNGDREWALEWLVRAMEANEEERK